MPWIGSDFGTPAATASSVENGTDSPAPGEPGRFETWRIGRVFGATDLSSVKRTNSGHRKRLLLRHSERGHQRNVHAILSSSIARRPIARSGGSGMNYVAALSNTAYRPPSGSACFE
jgi:hypothetical protein